MRRNWWILSLLVVLFVLGNANEVQGQSVTQWAIDASASSEYGSDPWSAKQMVGQPNVYPAYGDSPGAWAAAARDDGLQWVALGFLEEVYVDYVEVYETFNPGAIVKVELVDTSGRNHIIWEGPGGLAGTTPRVSRFENAVVTVPCNGVRITSDTESVPGWNEIDAVSITGSYNPSRAQGGSDMVYQWASRAKASSQYREDRWTPEQMTGRPDVYPKYGDYDKAWTATSSDGGEEWAELFFDEAVYVKRIEVYETYNPGAIVTVELIDETGRTYVVWEGRAKAAPEESRIFVIDDINVNTPARRVRLVLQTDQVPGWNEIDAVRLIGTRTVMQETREISPFELLAEIILRLGMAVERGQEQNLADPAFLQELEQIVGELSTISF